MSIYNIEKDTYDVIVGCACIKIEIIEEVYLFTKVY